MKGKKQAIYHLKLAAKIVFQPLIMKEKFGPTTHPDEVFKSLFQKGLNAITSGKWLFLTLDKPRKRCWGQGDLIIFVNNSKDGVGIMQIKPQMIQKWQRLQICTRMKFNYWAMSLNLPLLNLVY